MGLEVLIVTQYGSLVNLLKDRTRSEVPVVGMGCTILGWSDRYPGTVVKVGASGKTIWIQRDEARRTDKNGPYTENQSYIFIRQPEALLERASLRGDGRWRMSGRDGSTVILGRRSAYRDPTF